MNRWKFHSNTKRLIMALASLLTLIVIVMTGAIGYAATPDAAYIFQIKGTGLTIGVGDSRDRTRASEHQQLQGNKVLYVPGGNKSFAYLGFVFDWVQEHADLLVSAGPSPNPSEWSFPCAAKGGFTITWKKGENRGCEEGVKVQSSSKTGGLPNNNLQASRRLLAQAQDEVTVVPTPGESIIQTADSFAGININVLVGDVRVKSAKNPSGRLVKAGERYNYPQDTITPFDPNPILNSPEMQDFVNPNNWLSPNIPQRVADGIAGQLGEMRTTLSQLPQRTASQSTQPQRTTNQSTQSNNCNSRTVTQATMNNGGDGTPYRVWMDFSRGQEAISSAACGRQYWLKEDPNHPFYQIRFVYLVDGQGKCVVPYLYKETGGGNLEVVRPASECSSASNQSGVNLNGEWTFNFGYFAVKSDGSCEAAPNAGSYQGKITITQNGSQLNISPSGPVPMTNGNVSGNQFESRGQTPMRWVGTISSDGKKISGSGICGSVNMPFTMIR